MPYFNYEVEAFEEWSIEADTQAEADELAEQHFKERFEGMFGGVKFIEKVEDQKKMYIYDGKN